MTGTAETWALVEASRFLEANFSFRGSPASGLQDGAWPRTGAYDEDGDPIVGVPAVVKEVTEAIAGMLLSDIEVDDRLLEQMYTALTPVLAPRH